MGKLKTIALRIFLSFCRIVLPKKYFDSIFLLELIKAPHLKSFSPIKKIWCFFHGFLPHEYVWYELSHNDYRKYLPTRNSYQKRGINGHYNTILANKIMFEKHLKAVIRGIDNLHVIDSIGFIEQGFLNSLSEDIIHGDYSSLISILEKQDLIIKPTMGDGGKGIYLIKKESDNFFIEDKKLSGDEFIATLKTFKDHLIQKRFKQKGFSNEIYSGSVNTIRISTMTDPGTQRPFIGYAAHRFGSAISGSKDNISRGGIASLIDIQDGTLSEGLYFTDYGEKIVYKDHPISSKPIAGQKIPGWNNIINSLLEMAGRMPYFKYVGWDVILSDNEIFVLEGNVSPGLSIIQMYKPLSDLPATWNFYKYHKYI